MKKEDINDIRAFNRFYTRVIGLLDQYLADSRFTLPEVRVMYELHHHEKLTSKEIAELLGMDKGYLSRMLLSFEKKGLILRKADAVDGRIQTISLSAKGEKEFLKINEVTNQQISQLFSRLTTREIKELTGHMASIRELLSNIHQ